MPHKIQAGFHFTPEILREFLNPINREELIKLLKQWGMKNLDLDLDKVDLFLKLVGAQLSGQQLEDLWLLREKILIFRSRNWFIFLFSEKVEEIRDLQDLQKQCTKYLVEHELEFNNEIKVFKIGEEIYINLIYHGPFRLYEENFFDFKVIRSIQRIRCILNIEKGIIRINGRSRSKIQIIIEILKEIFAIEPKRVRIPAYKISDFVKAEKTIKKMTVTCPRTVGGFSGIEKITIEGSNVVDGLYNLQSRQEIPFSFQGLQKVGPITAASSDNARISNRGEVQISHEEHQDQLYQILQD